MLCIKDLHAYILQFECMKCRVGIEIMRGEGGDRDEKEGMDWGIRRVGDKGGGRLWR